MGDLIPFPPPQDPIEYCCPDCDCELFRLTSSGLECAACRVKIIED